MESGRTLNIKFESFFKYPDGTCEVKVWIGDKLYTYLFTQKKDVDTVQFYLNQGWTGKALNYAKKYGTLERR